MNSFATHKQRAIVFRERRRRAREKIGFVTLAFTLTSSPFSARETVTRNPVPLFPPAALKLPAYTKLS